MTKRLVTIKRMFLAAVMIGIILSLNYSVQASVRNADVTTASEGNSLIAVRGTYLSESKETILNRINEIRQEAADEQVISGYTYKPVKWSADLEWIAQLRAAEASILMSHGRPNGKSCFSVTHNGVSPNMEVLAWNYSGIMQGIEQWYSEKQDLVNHTGGETGHYTNMLFADYIGIGAFRIDGQWCTVAGDFYRVYYVDDIRQDASQSNLSGVYDQMVEVQSSMISGFSIDCKDTLYPGATEDINANICLSDGDGTEEAMQLTQNGIVTYTTSPEAVVSIDPSQSKITATGSGEVTITVTLGSMTAIKNIHVHDFTEWVVKKAAGLSEKGLKTRSCKLCGLNEEETIPAYGKKGSGWKKPVIKKVNVKKTKATITWKKNKKMQKRATKCEIQISKDKSFKKIVKDVTLSKKKTTYSFKGSKKTTYYVRMRYISSKKYSSWSTVKKFKLK